jgi:hypothetical protein
MRSLLVAGAAIAAIVAALAAALLWTGGRDLLDDERFAQDVIAAMRGPEGRNSLAVRVVDAIGPEGSPAASFVSRASIDAVVRRVVADPAFAAVLEPVVARAHRRFLGLSGDPVTIDLGGLREPVARELAEIDQGLPARLPSEESLRDIELATGIEAPGVPGARIAERATAVVGLLALAAVALAGVAVALAEGTRRAAAWVGALLVAAAAAPAAARLLLPEVARRQVPAPDDALAERLAAELLNGWWAATTVLGAAGALLLISASARWRRRPPTPRPAA